MHTEVMPPDEHVHGHWTASNDDCSPPCQADGDGQAPQVAKHSPMSEALSCGQT